MELGFTIIKTKYLLDDQVIISIFYSYIDADLGYAYYYLLILTEVIADVIIASNN
jgi:hypothetical protein